MSSLCTAVTMCGWLYAASWSGALAYHDAGHDAGQDPGPSAIEAWLAALKSDTAAERSLAQRSLEGALGWRDFDRLRAAALSGDAEVQRRLIEVLAADERRLELAVRLAADGAEPLSEVGRSAVGELISRWSTGYRTLGISAPDTAAELDGKFERVLSLDASQSPTLRTAIDQIARFAVGAPPLVVDPAWIEHPKARAQPIVCEGDLERLLLITTLRSGAAWEGFGFSREKEAKTAPWIFITAPRGLGRKSGHEHWIDWCVGVARPEGELTRSACARALACTGWPAALSWLEARWLELGDTNALEGMVAAADRGRAVQALAMVATQRELFARTHRELERREPAADARASEIARALAVALAHGTGGDDLAAPALELLRDADADVSRAQRWLALVVLEGHAAPSAMVRERVASIVARDEGGAAGPATRFQALRTLAACSTSGAGERTPAIGDAAGLLAWAESKGFAESLLELCAELDARPPSSWSDPALLPEAWETDLRARAFEWWLQSPDESVAARHLAAWLSRLTNEGSNARELEELAERLGVRMRMGERKRVESVLALTRAQPAIDARGLEELEVLSGSRSALGSEAIVARRLASAPANRRELLCLAALAASARGAEVRTAVVASLASPLALDDRLAALDRALLELRRARQVAVERAFVTAVRTASRNADRDVQSRLRVDQWPPPVQQEPVYVRLLDRVLDRTGL